MRESSYLSGWILVQCARSKEFAMAWGDGIWSGIVDRFLGRFSATRGQHFFKQKAKKCLTFVGGTAHPRHSTSVRKSLLYLRNLMSSSPNSQSVVLKPFRIFFGLTILTTVALLVMPAFLAAQSARKGEKPTNASSAIEATGTSVDASSADRPVSMQEKVQVMVELNAPPAAVPYAAALAQAHVQADAARANALAHPKSKGSQAVLSSKQPVQISAAAAKQVANTVRQLDQAQRNLLPNLTGSKIGGQVIFRVQRAYNGIAMAVAPSKIAAIAALPGVKAVHPIHQKYPTAPTDIDFLGTRSFWTSPDVLGGVHGENVKVGLIDSGLDYVHKNFGGDGDYTGVTDTNANGKFPNTKAPGGTDLAGDAYTGANSPMPDSNPFDGDPAGGTSAGHGTACASLIGGYGVDSSNLTYPGPYDGSNPSIASLKISPGFAPNCSLYPVRVFGSAGSTGLVTQAIEWCMDPDGNGDFSDKMDIISMSLGSNEGYADDDSAIAATNASSIGIVVCSAAGNAGDTYYIHSSPAAASGTLSVAASFNDIGQIQWVQGNTPPAISASKYALTPGSDGPPVPPGGITNDVVYAVPNTGETSPGSGVAVAALSNAAQVSGKICIIDRGGISFTSKVQLAADAGAVACIIVNNVATAVNPLVTVTSIYSGIISLADGNALKAAASFDATTGVAANPTNVTITFASASDTLPSYTARGPRLPDSSIKPDLTAPAEVVGVANNRTADGVTGFNGTSSATPHVAGSMALIKQLHPTWSVQELMALACNTATHNLFVPLTTAVGPQVGVGRTGAGRIDLAKAAIGGVVALNQADPNLLNISFGVVETPADGSSSLTKNITVKNNSLNSVTYNITYDDATPVAGTNFVLPASVTVGAGASASVPVTFTATGNLLKHVREASVDSTQVLTSGTLTRQWMTEKTGYAVFTPTSGPEPALRVALYASTKPASSMHATTNGYVPTASTGTFTINLSGTPVNTNGGVFTPPDMVSFMHPFELQYASPLAGSPGAPTDTNVLKYVGVTSDYVNAANKANTIIVFGLDGFGDAPVPEFNSSDREILIDTGDGSGGPPDGIFDFVLYGDSRRGANNIHSNVYRPTLLNLHSGSAVSLGVSTDAFSGTFADTNAFNNSAIIFPLTASTTAFNGGAGNTYPALASVGGPTFFQYQVVTFNRNGDQVDETPVMSYNLAAPGLDVEAGGLEPSMFFDLATNSLPVNYNGTNFQANGSLGVLLIHMHNSSGNRSDVVAFRKPTVSGFSPTSGTAGSNVTISGSNFGPGTTVKFFNNQTATINVITSNTLIATVPAGAVTGPIRVSNAAGTSTAAGNFTVLP